MFGWDYERMDWLRLIPGNSAPSSSNSIRRGRGRGKNARATANAYVNEGSRGVAFATAIASTHKRVVSAAISTTVRGRGRSGGRGGRPPGEGVDDAQLWEDIFDAMMSNSCLFGVV
ncbi:hypothetical protein AKJ16_DCAP02950 [Drosera capensis]